jgi:hypothetical protein
VSTTENTNSRTLISLREYVDIRFNDQEKAVNAALQAAERAVTKAEIASEKRFDSVNEFRAALSDSARLLMPRAEAEQRMGAIEKLVYDIKTKIDAKEDKTAGLSQGLLMIISIISVLSTVIMVVYWLSKSSY